MVNLHVPLNAPVSGYLSIILHNLSPFVLKIRKYIENMQKGDDCEILNQNNRRLGRLKVHVFLQISLELMGGNSTIFFLSDQSL